MKSSNLSLKFCEKCGKITEHSTYGYCLTCSNPAIEAIAKRIAQYREWTGDQNWQYDAEIYWQLAWEKIHEMVIACRTVSEVAQEFDCAENTVRSRVREYCRKMGLESLWKRKN